MPLARSGAAAPGQLYLTQVPDDDPVLEIFDIEDRMIEVISVNLETSYGLIAEPNCVWVRDYSEHSGLPTTLVERGPFPSQASESVVPRHEMADQGTEV